MLNKFQIQAHKCPTLEPIANGQIDSDQFSAVYRCNLGYDLLGASERVCLSSLQWSGSPPKCLRNYYFIFVYFCGEKFYFILN